MIITGAGRGLGRAYARAAADAGARVLVNDADGPSAEAVCGEIVGAGGEAIAHAGSVADAGAVEVMIGRCVDRFGAIDGLVNNAGIAYDALPWEEDAQAIRRLVEVNVLGSLFCGTRALARMRRQGHGVIVNVTSGARLGMPRVATYGATKGAVASMTFGWAADARAAGVRINAISPVARTHMSEGAAGVDAAAMADPDAIAPVVVFLLSDRSSPITGRVVRFDGRALSVFGPDVGKAAAQVAARWSARDIEAAVKRLAGPAT